MLRQFIEGEAYWKVIFQNGKELSELDHMTVLDPKTLRVVRSRKVEWLEDLIGSGDLRNVKEVMLATPKGTAHIRVDEPYTAFQMSRKTLSAFDGRIIKNMQMVGVVTDKDSGQCEVAIWDQQTFQLYTMINNVKDFMPWRDGIIPLGRLNIEVFDLRGVA